MGQIRKIFLQYIHIRTQISPVFLSAGGFQKIAQGHFTGKPFHNVDILVNRQILHVVYDFLRSH